MERLLQGTRGGRVGAAHSADLHLGLCGLVDQYVLVFDCCFRYVFAPERHAELMLLAVERLPLTVSGNGGSGQTWWWQCSGLQGR